MALAASLLHRYQLGHFGSPSAPAFVHGISRRVIVIHAIHMPNILDPAFRPALSSKVGKRTGTRNIHKNRTTLPCSAHQLGVLRVCRNGPACGTRRTRPAECASEHHCQCTSVIAEHSSLVKVPENRDEWQNVLAYLSSHTKIYPPVFGYFLAGTSARAMIQRKA